MGKRVITIHGIDTIGKWQDEVQTVLTPHFDCLSVKYSLFRRFGATKLLFESAWFLCIAIEGSFLAVLGLLSKDTLPLLLGLASLILALVAAVMLAHRTRARVRDQFKSFLDSRAVSSEPPHLIAHSYGTFLAANVMRKFPSMRFDRIVLAGCVLPRRFVWRRILHQNSRAFRHVRNEIAAKDWVPRLANFAKFLLLRGFGSAGSLGFVGHMDLIHNVDTPNHRCKCCVSAYGSTAKIHNVMHREYHHSDQFLGNSHARSFWLPYLWGIDPTELWDFVDMCSLAVSLEHDEDKRNVEIVERELRERYWAWAGMTLEEFVALHVLRKLEDDRYYRGRDLRRIVTRSVRLLWHAVRSADQEQYKRVKNEAVVKRLHPENAVRAAVISVFESLE